LRYLALTLIFPATDVEGIFRLAGSEKRIKELKAQFDAPPRWGKGLDWSGYTVHDAANILRRYFNQLPEPIIPLQHYDSLRTPLRGHQTEAVGHIEGQAPSVGGFDPDAVVRVYQQLIKDLPSLNRQLLLYILDLLAVFAAKADVNKMTTSNLAAIFQPGILSHPQHDMSPQDYRLSQDVLIFLIDNQDHFLIGMEGTAVDEGTARHVESGPSTPQVRTPTTPGRKTSLGRSGSAASSAAADSVRAFGNVRRNVSTSSRRSRHSGAVPSPTTPSYTSGSGVHRSNTLPSKRSPALPPAHFPRERGSDPTTPVAEDTKGLLLPTLLPAAAAELPPPVPEVPEQAKELEPPIEEPVQPAQRSQTMPVEQLDVLQPPRPIHIDMPQRSVTTPGLDMPGAFIHSPAIVPPVNEMITPAASAQVAHTLAPPPAQQPEQRPPQTPPRHVKSEVTEKPTEPGTQFEPTPAVRTFTQILSKVSPDEKSSGRKPNKLQKKRVTSVNPSAHSSTQSLSNPHHAHELSPSPLPHPYPVGMKESPHSYNSDTVSSRNSAATLKPSMSPPASFRSHSSATEYSEAEDMPKEEKKSFWKSHMRGESRVTPTASHTDLSGSIPNADKSVNSIGSSSGGGRRSLQYDSHQNSDLSVAYGDAKDHAEKKNPFDWFSKMRHEHKDRFDKKQRAKSPPGSRSNMSSPQSLMKPRDDPPVEDRPLEHQRPVASQDSSDVTPTGTSPNPLATVTAPKQYVQPPKQDVPPTAAPERTEPPVAPVEHQTAPGPTDNHPAAAPIEVQPTASPLEVQPATAPIDTQPPQPMRSMLDIGEESSKSPSVVVPPSEQPAYPSSQSHNV
jgi:hypothetical protein